MEGDEHNIGYTHGWKRYRSTIPNQTSQWFFQAITYNDKGKKLTVYLNRREPGNDATAEPIIRLKDIGRDNCIMNKLKLGSDYLRINHTYANKKATYLDARYVHDIMIFNKCLDEHEVLWLYENQSDLSKATTYEG